MRSEADGEPQMINGKIVNRADVKELFFNGIAVQLTAPLELVCVRKIGNLVQETRRTTTLLVYSKGKAGAPQAAVFAMCTTEARAHPMDSRACTSDRSPTCTLSHAAGVPEPEARLAREVARLHRELETAWDALDAIEARTWSGLVEGEEAANWMQAHAKKVVR